MLFYDTPTFEYFENWKYVSHHSRKNEHGMAKFGIHMRWAIKNMALKNGGDVFADFPAVLQDLKESPKTPAISPLFRI